MNITSAQYQTDDDGNNISIKAVIDNETFYVPIAVGNVQYDAIKAKHDDSNDSFTIQDAA